MLHHRDQDPEIRGAASGQIRREADSLTTLQYMFGKIKSLVIRTVQLPPPPPLSLLSLLIPRALPLSRLSLKFAHGYKHEHWHRH